MKRKTSKSNLSEMKRERGRARNKEKTKKRTIANNLVVAYAYLNSKLGTNKSSSPLEIYK